MKKPSALGALLLTLGALIWGTAFVAQSMGMDHVGPCAFNGARSFIGSLALLPVIFFRDKLRPSLAPQAQEEVYSWKNPALLRGGLLCGLFLSAASLLQQAGLQYTTAGKAGFLTSLYIVMVPVLGLFLGRKGGARLWLAVALALVGAFLLSVAGEELSIQLGDALELCCACSSPSTFWSSTVFRLGWMESSCPAYNSVWRGWFLPWRRFFWSREALAGRACWPLGGRCCTRGCCPAGWPTPCRSSPKNGWTLLPPL